MTAAKPRPSLMQRLGAPEAPPPWGLTAAAVAILVYFGLLVAGTLVAQAWFAEQPFTLIAGWSLGAAATIAFVLQTRRGAQRAGLRLDRGTTPLPFVVFLSFGLALLIDLIAILVTNTFAPAPEVLGLSLNAGGAAAWIFAGLFLLVLQPAASGLVFQGMTLPLLRDRAGAWFGLLAGSILMAVFHALAFPADYSAAFPGLSGLGAFWLMFVTPFLMALVVNAVRVVTGSTRAAIFAQAAFGLFILLKLIVGFGA